MKIIKKIFIFSILILNLQSYANADTLKCSTNGAFTKCYANGVNIINVQNLRNGFAVVQINYLGVDLGPLTGAYADTQYMSILEAKTLIDSIKYMYDTNAKLIEKEKQLAKQKKANEKIIVKRLSIITSNGYTITLEEDKNKDDFLTINNFKRTKIGSNLVNSKPTNSNQKSIYEIANAKRLEAIMNKNEPAPYLEIISKIDCNPLFKQVYKIRETYHISYEDAQKLMKFRKDNSDFYPEDLLLPNEIAERNYYKTIKELETNLSNTVFPTF